MLTSSGCYTLRFRTPDGSAFFRSVHLRARTGGASHPSRAASLELTRNA